MRNNHNFQAKGLWRNLILNDDFQRSTMYPLFEKLTGKSPGSQNKTLIRGASPGVPYKLRDKNAIGRRRWNIISQERKVCDMEIEIIRFIDVSIREIEQKC